MPGLKEELGNMEIEESEMDEEGRLREIEERIYGLHRRINVIVEHIDKEEEKATTEDSEYAKGYEDDVKALSEKLQGGIDEVKAKNEEIIEMIEKALSTTMPSFLTSLARIVSQTSIVSIKETTEEESDRVKEGQEPKSAKSRGLGLGKEIGDV